MPAKITLPQKTINDMCNMFKSGTSIPILMSTFSLSRNKITKTLRDNLGDDYHECAKRILAGASAKGASKRKGRKNPHTPEQNKKIGDAMRGKKLSQVRIEQIKESWKQVRMSKTPEQIDAQYKKSVETKRQNGCYEIHSKRHSEWMKINAPMRGKKMSEESRQKMRLAKHQFFSSGGKPSQLGIKRSLEQRNIISDNTKRMWAEGKFSYGDSSVMRSKLEKNFYEQVLTIFPDAQHSRWLTVDDVTYVFDIFIPSLQTFIEINGNYWHLNPRIYKTSHIDMYRGVTAQEIWERDEKKRNIAKNLGYKVVTIWEDEITTFDLLALGAPTYGDERPSAT